MERFPVADADCPWDCGDHDGNVGIIDFLELLAQWGLNDSCDIDGSGAVGHRGLPRLARQLGSLRLTGMPFSWLE